MTSPSYQITATPALLERVHYAIKRVRERPEMTAKAINAEIASHFGKPLAPTHWTVINAARRDNALEQITVKAFDFSKHGRNARLGKSKDNGKPRAKTTRRKRRPASGSALSPDPARHGRILVAVWRDGKLKHQAAATRAEARKLVRGLLADGVPVTEIAVYSLDPTVVTVS